MPDYIIDRRDIDFVLFEQFNLAALAEHPLYGDFDRDAFDAILDAGQKLCIEVVAPINAKADSVGCHLSDGKVKVPETFHAVWKQFAEGGWIAPSRPTQYGGMGLPLPLAVVLAEMAIGACQALYFFPGLNSAAGALLENFAAPFLRDTIVPRLYSGEWTGTMCLTEPQAGSSVGDLSTTATPISGTNVYSIKGNKIFITAGDHDLTENIVHLVLARVPGDPKGTKGISLFAVPKLRFDEQGKVIGPNDVTCTTIEEKMGIHGSPTCALGFGEHDDCQGYLIGERSHGIIYMFQMMNEARIVCGVQGVAVANAAYQAALHYAKERLQGTRLTERSPDASPVAIIEHPDVRRNLLLCKAFAEGCRALLMRTAFYAERAERHPDASQRPQYQDMLDLLTPICKAYATDVGFDVTALAMQVHGGYGYIKEYGIEQMMRDVKIASIYEGTNGIQALDLLGRKLRLREGLCS
ncbi:MAG: acyl-CoA dehydrogenase family protein [Myxococcota bacterium]